MRQGRPVTVSAAQALKVLGPGTYCDLGVPRAEVQFCSDYAKMILQLYRYPGSDSIFIRAISTMLLTVQRAAAKRLNRGTISTGGLCTGCSCLIHFLWNLKILIPHAALLMF